MGLKFLYEKQIEFQKQLINEGLYSVKADTLPFDNINLYSFHVKCLQEELGELILSDKRWKNYRNAKYDRKNKLEEIADCFIELMNIGIFSGFSSEEIEDMILRKIKENNKRIEKETK